MSDLDAIMHKLDAIEAAVAGIQEALGMLLEALQPPAAAPVHTPPAIATYEQMYGKVETPPEPPQRPAPVPSKPKGLWGWLMKEDV